MAEIIALADRRRARATQMPASGLAFYFDLSCPFSYLAAERVEWTLGDVDWVPVARRELKHDSRPEEEIRVQAERRASELRLPLVWPDRFPAPVPGALRAAQCAAQSGAGARFSLAAARLAFCGGFDLEDPEVLAEAAAAAGMSLEDCLAVAGDAAFEAPLRATAMELVGQGLRELPAVRVGSRLFVGEERLSEAAALLDAHAQAGAATAWDARPGDGGWDLGRRGRDTSRHLRDRRRLRWNTRERRWETRQRWDTDQRDPRRAGRLSGGRTPAGVG